MRIKKRLYWDLIFRYIFFLLAAIVVTVVFLSTLIFITINTISKYPDIVKNSSIYINKIEYDNRTKELNLPMDIEESAWVEILKDNKVIYIEGQKQDDKMEYTQEELAFIANNADEKIATNKYTAEYIPFTGLDGEKYTFIYKKPRTNSGVFKIDFDLPDSLRDTDFEKEIYSKIKLSFFTFILLITIIILLFSRITTKKIMIPLKEINNGLKSVMAGNYSTRLDFEGSYEFNQVRDAFNYMTERIKIAERENKSIAQSKKRLLLDISHDLRTPATVIQGYAEALYDDMVVNEKDRKVYLKYIYEKSKTITNLIERLFKYSKLDSSIFDLDRKIEDLSEFLRNVVIGFYGELDNKGFELDINIPEKKIYFNFDEIELERAIANIIGNIIKYNPKHTKLSLSLMEDGKDIQIIIGDNGVGIPENIRENIFNALVRGDNTRKTDGGTGLGLAISKKIIELHGGTISVESEVGKGSEFFINFKRTMMNI